MSYKILIFIQSMRSGGAERVASILANAWSDQGEQVCLATLDEERHDAFEVNSGIKRISLCKPENSSPSLWKLFSSNLSRFFQLRRLIVQEQPDIILGLLPTGAVLSIIASRGTAAKVYAVEHTHPPNFPMGRIRETFRRLTYKLADATVVLTEKSAQWVRETYNYDNVAVIPNPVIFPLPVSAPHVSWEDHVSPDCKVLIAAGRLETEKQFTLLIDAFFRISHLFPDWHLVILGEGSLRPVLLTKIRKLALESRILLPGRVGNIGDWFQRSDLFVLTSRFEGFPNVLVEAMASGCPAVSLDCDTGPRDIIRDGVDGYLVPPDAGEAGLAERLSLLMRDRQTREEMGLKAKEIKDRLSIDRILRQWNELFKISGKQ